MRFKHATTSSYPLKVELGKGRYKWCACGKTKKVPFCDGTCKGAKPLKFEIKKKRTVALCNCGLSTTPPYCDGKAHKKLEKKK